MAVIPLIPGNTVAYTQEGFHAAGGLEGSAILIVNCEYAQLDGVHHKVSYDLRVGREYRDHRHGAAGQIGDGGEIVLLPGMAVIIQTEEYVHFPRSAFGVIVPKVSLLQLGLSNTTSKVDPGYNGPLIVTAFNLGKRTITLCQGEAFCCLYVLRVEDGAGLYIKGPKRIDDLSPATMWDRIRDGIEARRGLLSALLLGTSLLLIIINVLLLWGIVEGKLS